MTSSSEKVYIGAPRRYYLGSMENILSITHATDIDGVGSAALIRKKYRVHANRLFFGDYNREHSLQLEKEITSFMKPGTTLFIADLSASDRTFDIFMRMIRKVKAGKGRVYWFDHHPWGREHARMASRVCDTLIYGESDNCGMEITRKELHMGDKFSRYLCRIVHFSDYNIKPKLEREHKLVGLYALSIAYYHTLSHGANLKGLRHIAEVLSEGRLFDERIKADAEKFRRLNDRNLKRMLGEIYLGDDIALGFAGDIQKTYACMKLIEKTGRDIGIYVNTRDHKGHMRSVRSDCSKLANRFHGGGHPHASGFNPDFAKYHGFRSRKDRERLLLDLISAAKELGLSKKANLKKNRSSLEPLFN